jgi:hypothetical protein
LGRGFRIGVDESVMGISKVGVSSLQRLVVLVAGIVSSVKGT